MTNLENQSNGSRIFKKYKTLGLISSHIGHVTRFHKTHAKHYVIVAVGNSFKSYNCDKLGLCQISNPCPSAITCIAADSFYIYVGCENVIYVYKAGRQVLQVLEGHECDVHLLLPFGKHLISVDASSHVKVWHITSGELYVSLNLNESFGISTLLHPSTYVNKVVFGSDNGLLQLWNISKGKMLAEFSHWKDNAITALQQSTAVDVIGIGTENGDIALFNLRYDAIILKLHSEYGSVTSISFRMDGHEHMATGTVMGHICLWDLAEKVSIGIMEHAHTKAVGALTFLPSQPLLLSNSSDNSLKIWAFDKGNSSGRLLRERSGHAGPSTKVAFYNDMSIISAGCDSTVRKFSCEHVSSDKPLGKAMYRNTVLPAICDFHMNDVREGQWDGAVALHYRNPVVTTWNIPKGRMGSHKIVHERFRVKGFDKLKTKTHYASSVFLTSCGNFCVIGHNTGHVDVHNVQSGIHRGSFVDNACKKSKAHCCSVTGIAVDSLNQITVSVGTNKEVKFWKFKSKLLLDVAKIEHPPSFVRFHSETGMIVIVLDNFSFIIMDVISRKLVRSFSGHTGAIIDCCWNSDGKWILTSSNDCDICIWDVPSGCLVDRIEVNTIATGLAISPNCNLLATAHVEETGICLWTNMSLSDPVSLHSLDDNNLSVSTDSIEMHDLVCLSDWPVSKWQGLMTSDVIRARNKPIAPPKAPESAPFFLPSLVTSDVIEQKVSNSDTQMANMSTSRFVQVLENFDKNLTDSKAVFDFMEKLQPSTVDFEIQNLIDWHGSCSHVIIFMNFLEAELSKKKNFEVVNAYLGLLMKKHAGAISLDENVLICVQRILTMVEEAKFTMTGLINQNLSVVNYIKTALL
uniref:WD repeat-containing protein 36-like n=1 Tax=Phallusia mammillata TaxID=59560 RepID=A0A6F9DW66_9ASCI|nr:WD repeat-containing protein 36-like [Phallusia mammillata]